MKNQILPNDNYSEGTVIKILKEKLPELKGVGESLGNKISRCIDSIVDEFIPNK